MSNLAFPTLRGVYLVNRVPFFDTNVKEAKTGPEYRVAERPVGYRFTLRISFLRPSLSEHKTLCDFFEARRGRLDSFIFADTWEGTPGVERRVRFDEDELDLEYQGGVWSGMVTLRTVEG